MPRYTFGTATLKGASGGLGALAQAIAKGGHTEQDAYDKELMTQSRIGQAIAQMQAAQAAGRAHDAQAAAHTAETDVLNRRPDLFREQVANQSGVDMPTVDAYRATLRGESPMVPMGPPTEGGDMGVGAAKFGPETTSKLSGAIKQFLPLLSNMNDLKPDDLAQADQIYRTGRLSDDIISGKLDRNTVGGAQAAAAGKDLYKTDTTGAVLDPFGGSLDTANPLAQSTIGLRGAQAGQANAAASEHYAGAGEKKARTTQIKQETEQGGGGKTPAGYRWNADHAALEAIPGGPAIKEPSEGERKAGSLLMRLRGSQQQLMTALGQNPSAQKPVPAAEFVRSIPWVGGDTPANLITPAARQQIEAAQLDMLDAALTLGTGAAYTKEQLRGYAKSYFPQIGDKPEALRDKQVRLANVIRAAEIAAGRAAEKAVPNGGANGSLGDTAPTSGRNVQVDY